MTRRSKKVFNDVEDFPEFALKCLLISETSAGFFNTLRKNACFSGAIFINTNQAQCFGFKKKPGVEKNG